MSNSYSEKTDPSSIYTRFNTRYVIPLFSYTDTLFEWSQMKIIKLEFPIFWYETFFMFKTSLLLLNFCLCVYVSNFVSRMDKGFVKHFDEPAMNLCLYGFLHLRNPINVRQIELLIICLYSEGSEDRFVVVQHFLLRKICHIVCRVEMSNQILVSKQ